jgi:hypothetical protein
MVIVMLQYMRRYESLKSWWRGGYVRRGAFYIFDRSQDVVSKPLTELKPFLMVMMEQRDF